MTEPTVPRRRLALRTFVGRRSFGAPPMPSSSSTGAARVLFVNAAWESLTAIPAVAARSLVCRRPRPTKPGDSPEAILEHALTPPPEVLDGQTTRIRRLRPDAMARRHAGTWKSSRFAWTDHGRRSDSRPYYASRRRRDCHRRAFGGKPDRAARADGPKFRPGTAVRRRAVVAFIGGPSATSSGDHRACSADRRTGYGQANAYRGASIMRARRRSRPIAALDCVRLPAAAIAEVLFGDAAARWSDLVIARAFPSAAGLSVAFMRMDSRAG